LHRNIIRVITVAVTITVTIAKIITVYIMRSFVHGTHQVQKVRESLSAYRVWVRSFEGKTTRKM
jgi:hypothetical protein